jgi:BON domain-containing protein
MSRPSLRLVTARRALALALLGLVPALHAQEERTNAFDDPFLRVTRALAACPVPQGPLYTAAEAKAQAHGRAERGTTCHDWGRCRLPNAYLYDKEIIPRVATFIQRDERFRDTSVWIVGQRRWVYLEGCVSTQAQSDQLEAEVRLIDDVEAVINELMVGTSGTPPYDVDRSAR